MNTADGSALRTCSIQNTPSGAANNELPAITPGADASGFHTLMRIVAPGNGRHDYQLLPIDLRAFPDGGILQITIHLHRDSATAGSFDLFPGNALIPVSGRPTSSMGGRYDVPPGTRFEFTYKFARPQQVLLGAEGNWFSPPGSSGIAGVSLNVQPSAEQLTAAAAGAGSAPARSLATGQIWRGSYRCAQGVTPLTLEVTDVAHAERETPYGDGKFATAVFRFGGQGSGLPSGSYNMEGAILEDGTIRLDPQGWIHQPPGYHMVGLSGAVGAAGRFSGRILDASCSGFALGLARR